MEKKVSEMLSAFSTFSLQSLDRCTLYINYSAVMNIDSVQRRQKLDHVRLKNVSKPLL